MIRKIAAFYRLEELNHLQLREILQPGGKDTVSIGSRYAIGGGSQGVMGMRVREMIRNTPKLMYILTTDGPPQLRNPPRACGQR